MHFQDMVNLTLVCKLFRAICQPYVFYHAGDIQMEIWEEDDTPSGRVKEITRVRDKFATLPSVNVLRMIRQHINLGDHFGRVFWDEATRPIYQEALRLYISALPLFQNISTMYLWDFFIDKSLCTSLESLKNLRRLELHKCQVDHGDCSTLALTGFVMTWSTSELRLVGIVVIESLHNSFYAPSHLAIIGPSTRAQSHRNVAQEQRDTSRNHYPLS